ncbi:MAG: aminoacyl-histidine dipeptidase [Thermoplasmata archaeon]|nr:aminoacyl-histidine dipeptidase [Thermoplasmata archaeon]
MSGNITHLKPENVWRYFQEISRIPRCSKNEKAVGDYIVSVAEGLGLDYTRDAAGNVVIRKPAFPGYEHALIVVLQAHMDMVCEKDSDKVHDFTRDPIELVVKGDWLYANGTTLGADNGIGLAAILAIMEDKSLVHGPMEFLITVDEETGMTGAFGLSGDMMKGRTIINLDTEEEGSIYIGCAGGGDTAFTLPVASVDTAEMECTPLKIKVHGLKGGHSGVDIHEGRANANKALTRILNIGNRATSKGLLLANFQGGSKRNAIPREAEAIVLFGKEEKEGFIRAARSEAESIIFEYRAMEPDLAVDFDETEMPDKAANKESTAKALQVLTAIPNGVLAMSLDIPDLVETSTNLAIVELDKEKLKVGISTRSSIKSALAWARSIHRAIGELAGARVEDSESYPGWKPELDSHVLRVASEVHEKLFGKVPEKKAIHAGLECGLIKEKFPGMDAISIGPQIEHPHSPTERVKISSVDKFYRHVVETLRALAEEGNYVTG